MAEPAPALRTPYEVAIAEGLRHSEDGRIWYVVPDVSDLIQFGGHPGCQYAWVGTERGREYECAQNGWRRVPNWDEQGQPCDSGLFKLIGPTGERLFCAMQTGTAIPGASPFGGARECWIDPELLEGTGLTLAPPAPLAPAKAPAPAKPPAAPPPR